MDRIRFGTSSFSSKDWVGPFYEPGTNPSEFLRKYSKQFDTVEIDSTYYTIPNASAVKGWIEKTPPGFLISAKFPRSIVHGGEEGAPDPAKLLTQEHSYPVRDRFLEAMSLLGDRLGTLVLQFPYLSKKSFASKKLFAERLERFLDDLPSDFSYGVEIRNQAWLDERFAQMLRKRSVALVLADQAWMPHGDEILQKFDPVTSKVAYIRLIGDRKEIEGFTKTWEKEVIDRTDRLERWADFLITMIQRDVTTLVYANNHYSGHAPATIRRLMDMVKLRLEKVPE